MRPKRAPLALVVMTLALTARAADPASDAPAGVPAPAPLSWRVQPAASGASGVSFAPQADPSAGLLLGFKAALAKASPSKGRTEVEAALDSLIKGADEAPAAERQDWIDAHLGELNASVRALGADEPKELALEAASRASALNNRAERWEEGRDLAELALQRDPEYRDALIARSRASAGLGDWARAYSDADAVLRKAPEDAGAWTARAAASYGLGNYLQSVEDARRALALDANDSTAYALMKLSEGRAQPAPRFENSSIATSVEREYHGMVQQLNQVEAIRRAPAEAPENKAIRRHVEAAGAKLAVKDYHGALDEADRALALDAGSVPALYYRAAAQNLLGRYGDAERDASKGLSIMPSTSWLRDARAWAYLRMGRYSEAIADANHSLEIDPKNPYAFANRGHAHEARGELEQMAADLKRAAELNATFEPDYRDSLRRHGLKAELIPGRLRVEDAEPPAPSRGRSFAVVLVFSVAGGLLIGLGLMHVGSGFRDRKTKASPAQSAIEHRYELGRAIGQGGMGVVYEARDKNLKRQVAIKMLRDEFQLDDAAKKAFVDEARTVAELQHPSIVDIHAVEQDERGLYLVFERLEGRTLDELIAEQKRLPLKEIKRILGAVCSALTYAHGRDVIHRDLKPGNVMLTKEGGVKVLDFGISRHAARAGKSAATTQTVVGTPHYMAPEQEYGFVRRENDVFALGAVLYEMLTGVRPYEGPTPAKLAKSYLRASRRLPHVSPELDGLIDRALEPDPDKRTSSPAEFWAQLSAIPDAAA